MDDDEFEGECMALEAIFPEHFQRQDGRQLCVIVEPTTPEGETLTEWAFSLLMEIPEDYPMELPNFRIFSVENAVYSPEAKKELLSCLEQEASGMQGEQMIYNLVEWVREHLMDYVEMSKKETRQAAPSPPTKSEAHSLSEPKKEKMTKAQKRRYYSRFGAVDEKPRGWNWVDIIAHLSSRPQQNDPA